MKWVAALVAFVVFAGAGGATFAQPQGLEKNSNSCAEKAKKNLGGKDVAALAAEAGFTGDDVAIAVAVAKAESGWRSVRSKQNRDGSYDHGFWQINSIHKQLLASGDWRDPHDNAKMAYEVWKGAGWSAWTTFQNGAHIPFLDEAAKAAKKVVCEKPVISGPMRQRIVEIAKSTLTSRTGYYYYSWYGPMTDTLLPANGQRSDCSQWVRAVYLAAGAPDPGFTTHDQPGNGTHTSNPQPGDLMFTGYPGFSSHVELYVGNGKTIGHGSPPINYGRVSYWPQRFYRSYL